MEFTIKAIGVINTPFKEASGAPIQPVYAKGAEGEVVLCEDFEAALKDIEGFERIWLVYLFHKANPYKPLVVPYRDTEERGIFATRAPSRPNALGLSVVRLVKREGARLKIADVDILDGTPLIDIKPYVPTFDSHPVSRAGWLEASMENRELADDRFHRSPESLRISEGGATIHFKLATGCIEMSAKRVWKELVNRIVSGEDISADIKAAVELLGDFLGSAEFGEIRAKHKELSKASGVIVQIRRDKSGRPVWSL